MRIGAAQRGCARFGVACAAGLARRAALADVAVSSHVGGHDLACPGRAVPERCHALPQ